MIFDIEGDGLNPTKIHVLSYTDGDKIRHTYDYDEMRELLTNATVLIGHNIILFDIPVLERILSIKIHARLIDTLPLSWYLNHKRVLHGLESYGTEFGFPKPKVDDWENLPREEYAKRCDADVEINKRLWAQLKGKLLELYDSKEEADRLITYLMFKMDTVREQEKSKWKVNVDLVKTTIAELEKDKQHREVALKKVMPTVKVYRQKDYPAKPYKKDGTYSVQGALWFKLLKDQGLPKDYKEPVSIFVREEEPNPGSSDQVKNWLFSLGWEPATYKYNTKPDGTENKVPQVRVDGDDGKELCPSVKELEEIEPSIQELEGLTTAVHRLSVLNNFLSDMEDGYLRARVAGLTNTLRFKHKELVNLPGVDKPYGTQIRGSLVTKEGKVLCGSDMVSLESTTKRHYMYPYDPEYVIEMSKPGFDEHLDLAKHAGAVSQVDIDNYQQGIAPHVKGIRKNFKKTNYSAVYGIRKRKLSRELRIKEKDAQGLLDAYWGRNWSVLEVVKNTLIKHIHGEMWLFNPVSKFWYSLRYEKDIFSTLNQGTGVYCFDTWIKHFREERPQITAQFHDEVVLEIKEGYEKKCEEMLKRAIDKTNKELILNVPLDVDIQFGKNYAEIH